MVGLVCWNTRFCVPVCGCRGLLGTSRACDRLFFGSLLVSFEGSVPFRSVLAGAAFECGLFPPAFWARILPIGFEDCQKLRRRTGATATSSTSIITGTTNVSANKHVVRALDEIVLYPQLRVRTYFHQPLARNFVPIVAQIDLQGVAPLLLRGVEVRFARGFPDHGWHGRCVLRDAQKGLQTQHKVAVIVGCLVVVVVVAVAVVRSVGTAPRHSQLIDVVQKYWVRSNDA
mmetsp:Transcript_27975/g.61628  ORF Transcript_27975/g.61628 Transcript_27975/m.61628 type:complete len:230 (-) Transcript_27975:1140-1829(-)